MKFFILFVLIINLFCNPKISKNQSPLAKLIAYSQEAPKPVCNGPGTFSVIGELQYAPNWGYNNSSVFLPNKSIFYAGGFETLSSSTASNSAELVTITNKKVTSKISTMNFSRAGHTATLLSNGNILIAGGRSSTNNNSNVIQSEIFNLTEEKFNLSGNLNTARNFHSAVLLQNGNILLSGGIDSNGNTLSSAELFISSNSIFLTTGNMIHARSGHTMTLLDNGKVLVIGGYKSSQNLVSEIEIFDPNSGSFTVAGKLNIARYLHTVTKLSSGKFLISGGATNSGSGTNKSEILDTSNFSISEITQNVSRFYHGATLLDTNFVLLAGGAETAAQFLSSAEFFNPNTNQFTTTGSMSYGRPLNSIFNLGNCEAIVLLGQGFSTGIKQVELYSY